MDWSDITDIAISLEETYPDRDIVHMRFTDLWTMIQALPGFKGDPNASSEKILEAVQAQWLQERGY